MAAEVLTKLKVKTHSTEVGNCEFFCCCFDSSQINQSPLIDCDGLLGKEERVWVLSGIGFAKKKSRKRIDQKKTEHLTHLTGKKVQLSRAAVKWNSSRSCSSSFHFLINCQVGRRKSTKWKKFIDLSFARRQPKGKLGAHRKRQKIF